MTDKNLRTELTDLTEAVRELRDREVAGELAALRTEVEKLRAERAGHHCHGCSCMHIHWQPTYAWTVPGTVTYPNYVVTSGTSTVTTTNVAAGGVTTLGISN